MDILKYYSILELDHDAVHDDLERAYRTMKRKWRPGSFSSGTSLNIKARGKIKQIKEAYEALKPHVPHGPVSNPPSGPVINAPVAASGPKKTRPAAPLPVAVQVFRTIKESSLFSPAFMIVYAIGLYTAIALVLEFRTDIKIRGRETRVPVIPRVGGESPRAGAELPVIKQSSFDSSRCAGLAQDDVTKGSDPSKSDASDLEPIKLTAGKEKAYSKTYEDPFVRHIRKALNKYLYDYNEDDRECNVLMTPYRDYYKSKFVVCTVNHSLFGGKVIQILFQDKPDAVFYVWVYDKAPEGYELRQFIRRDFTELQMTKINQMFRYYIRDKEKSI
ncbi:DnaJ domain-containing protein [Fibrobacterota bacterium]